MTRVSVPVAGKGFWMNHLASFVAALVLALVSLIASPAARAQQAGVHISQHAHTSWTARDGYTPGLVFAMAQTPDGYLWLAGEYGLFRFDGLKFLPWQPPTGQSYADKPYSLLVSRDGTLWIGSAESLASWNGRELTRYPELDKFFITSLLEDRDGTIWAGVLADKGRLCQIREGRAHCHLQDGDFGRFVWSLAEDASGTLWLGADSGLWRWKPGPATRVATQDTQFGDLITSANGALLAGVRGGGLRHRVDGRLEPIPIRHANRPQVSFADQDIKSNKLLRDRDGGIWIGTDGRGLIHVQNGIADTFGKADGLSGNIACSLFEDREGNIWYASERGLDRFRKLPVITFSTQQGLSSEATKSVIAARDGSIWVASNDGVTRWMNGKTAVFRRDSGLPDLAAQSLYQDFAGRIWVSTARGLSHLSGNRFVTATGMPGKEAFSITGDEAGNLWLSNNDGLSRFHDGRFVELHPWSALGRRQQAKVIIHENGGVWLSFWMDGGVLYFKDGEIRARYTAAEGLGAGHVGGMRLDRDGAIWAATEDGGLSRIQDGRIATLTVANGLPCNSVHWSIEDDHRALWLYTACGLVRIQREEIVAWLSDPGRGVATKVWGAADGVTLRSLSPAYFNPPVAKAADGSIWFVSGEGVQVIDPDHLPYNTIPPPVHIERVVADRVPYAAAGPLRLPPLVRDVSIEFTALSLTDARNVRFRIRLEGHDVDWQEFVDRRQVSYSNLSPGAYRFHVMASNNSGVWNEEGAQLEFSIAAAFYQRTWFRVAMALLLAGLVWGGVQLRIHRHRLGEKRLRDVVEGIPAMAFSVHPDGSPDLVNRRWLEYTGLSTRGGESAGWQSTVHPDDLNRHLEKWRQALATGKPFENEARHRNASGEYRWFLVQAVPLKDTQGRILKWYGTLSDIEERKRAEEERERLRQLESHLAHTNRLSMLGELTASLAHEINQPIGAVVASAGAGLRWLDHGPPEIERAREAMVRIKDDGKRAADIIAGLKAFYRKETSPQRALLDMNEVVREMLVLLHREAERHFVVMRTELASDLPLVRADRVQMQQVLMNLMVNGIEAMGAAGGELVIRTAAAEQGLVVSVSDTGPGIPADQMDQIFCAFATTKLSGTGMGLTISRTIVEAHEGRLWAESEPGHGATFHFSLPAALSQGIG